MWAIFTALAGGIGLLLYGCFLVIRATGGDGLPWWAGAMIVVGILAGCAANAIVGLLALYSFDPVAHPLGGIDKRTLGYAVVGTGMLAVVTSFTDPNLMMLIMPGLIPAIAVLFLVVRPRFRAIREARGAAPELSFHEKRAKAFEEAQAERKAQVETRERYEKLKRQRLAGSGSGGGTPPRSDKAARGRPATGGDAAGDGRSDRDGRSAAGGKKGAAGGGRRAAGGKKGAANDTSASRAAAAGTGKAARGDSAGER